MDTSSSSSSSSSAAAVASGDSGAASGVAAEPFGGYGAMDEEDEDALMQKALEMSMSDMTQGGSGGSSSAPVQETTAVQSIIILSVMYIQRYSIPYMLGRCGRR